MNHGSTQSHNTRPLDSYVVREKGVEEEARLHNFKQSHHTLGPSASAQHRLGLDASSAHRSSNQAPPNLQTITYSASGSRREHAPGNGPDGLVSSSGALPRRPQLPSKAIASPPLQSLMQPADPNNDYCFPGEKYATGPRDSGLAPSQSARHISAKPRKGQDGNSAISRK